MTRRIFLTGASGCLGHYIAAALMPDDAELFLLVRTPAKFKLTTRPGVTLLRGDLQDIARFDDLLQTINCAILAATCWGGPEIYDVNVSKTLELIRRLNPEVCQQVIYFSTASILDRQQHLLPEANAIGTDYIRSKYQCFQQLSQLASAPPIRVLFPTLVFGGDAQMPYSHISAGMAEVARWLKLVKFFQIEGSFHFIHGQDVAQVVRYLCQHPDVEVGDMVLGNEEVTIEQAITAMCHHLQERIYFRLPFSPGLIYLLLWILRVQLAAWDRFCLTYRYFGYAQPVNPATFGLPSYCATVTELLQVSLSPTPSKSSKKQ